MQGLIRELVEAEWESRLGVDRSLLRSGGVHVVSADLGANDAMSFLLSGSCILVVPQEDVEKAWDVISGLEAGAAFSAETLRALVGPDAQIDGPSVHSYVDEHSFSGVADRSATLAGIDDLELVEFLDGIDSGDRAESGFPRDPSTADPETTQFWLLRDNDRVVAAGNMTEWRGRPADVGVLTAPIERGRGHARRLVGAMVASALPSTGVVRYRALASNTASLAVARRLGFVEYGRNFRARKPVR